MDKVRNLIITDYGEIEAPEWFVRLWHERKHKLPWPWFDLPDRETSDGLRVSLTEAYLLIKRACE